MNLARVETPLIRESKFGTSPCRIKAHNKRIFTFPKGKRETRILPSILQAETTLVILSNRVIHLKAKYTESWKQFILCKDKTIMYSYIAQLLIFHKKVKIIHHRLNNWLITTSKPPLITKHKNKKNQRKISSPLIFLFMKSVKNGISLRYD